MTPFLQNWYGQSPRCSASYAVTLDQEQLTFCFRAEKAPEHGHHPRGHFVEGLWNHDVAELFLTGAGPGYQEFNFSPSGAWWSAVFGDYRQIQRACPEGAPEIEAVTGSGFWQVRCRLALDSLLPWSDSPRSQWRLHVASILYPEDPEYLCSGHTSGGTPDFHRASLFHALP